MNNEQKERLVVAAEKFSHAFERIAATLHLSCEAREEQNEAIMLLAKDVIAKALHSSGRAD